MKKLLAFALLCAAVMTHASTSYAQMVANGCPVGRGTNVQGYANACFETVAAMEAATIPDAVTEVETLNFYATPLGGGARYRYYGSSAPSYGCYRTTNGATKYWVPKVQQISDKQCGAKVDGSTYDDAAILAMSQFVNATGTPFYFGPGTRKVMPVTNTTFFVIDSVTSLSGVFDGAVFELGTTQYFKQGIALSFTNAQNVTLSGSVTFRGDIVNPGIPTGGFGYYGAIGIRCRDNCSGWNSSGLTINAEGIGMADQYLSDRAARINRTYPVVLLNGGSGYVTGDTVYLDANYSGPDTVRASFTVTEVAGVITALTPVDYGYYPGGSSGRPGHPYLTVGVTGVALTGGSGTGALVNPYIEAADEDLASRGVNAGLSICYNTYYCSSFDGQEMATKQKVISNNTFRSLLLNSNFGITARVSARNFYQDAIVISAQTGYPTENVDVDVEMLPRTEAWLNAGVGALFRMQYTYSPGIIKNVNINVFGEFREADSGGPIFVARKYATDPLTPGLGQATDTTTDRDHILIGLSFQGQIRGLNTGNGGCLTNGIICLDNNVSWAGERISNVNLDNLVITTYPASVFFDPRGFDGPLNIGPGFQSAGLLTFNNSGGTAWLSPPAGSVVNVSPLASYANRYNAVLGFPASTDWLTVTTSMTLPVNWSGKTIWKGAGDGNTDTLTLPTCNSTIGGTTYTIKTGTTNGSSYYNITPASGQSIAGLGTDVTATMTSLNASVTLQCPPSGLGQWQVSGLVGTTNIPIGALNVTSLTASGLIQTTDTTNSTSPTSGSLRTAGGAGVALNLFVGSTLSVFSDLLYANAASNRVGIGADTPDVKLQVVGQGTAADGIEIATASGASRKKFLSSIDGSTAYLDAYDHAAAGYPLYIQPNSGTTRFGGNVGIRAAALSSANAAIGASTTGRAQINLDCGGMAPSAPNTGDFWCASGNVLNYKSATQTNQLKLQLTAALSYYVATTGSDSNDCLSALTPCLTVQAAWNKLAVWDLNGNTITLNVADGTYAPAGGTQVLNVTAAPTGTGTVAIVGNTGTPANVLWSTTSANVVAISAIYIPTITFSGMKFQTTTSGSAISHSGTGSIGIGSVDFGTVVSTHMITGNSRSSIQITGSYTISGNAATHMQAGNNSLIASNTVTVTLTGTPAFGTQFAFAFAGATISIPTTTFSGSATGQRYTVSRGGLIDTGTNTSGSYFPGSTAGVVTSGGSYNGFYSPAVVTTQFDKNNVTLANVTGLGVAVANARTYQFAATLFTTSDIAGGVKAAINCTTCTASSIIYETAVQQGGANQVIGTSRGAALGTTVGDVTAVTAAVIYIRGTITTSAAGTLNVQFANNAATGTSSVLVGSTLTLQSIN